MNFLGIVLSDKKQNNLKIAFLKHLHISVKFHQFGPNGLGKVV